MTNTNPSTPPKQPANILNIIHGIWAAVAIIFCTLVGIDYGWHTYGIGGAIGCGLLGLIVGSILGAAPQIFLQPFS